MVNIFVNIYFKLKIEHTLQSIMCKTYFLKTEINKKKIKHMQDGNSFI